MINEENSLGALTRTYIGRTLAHIEGTNPATGTARYYFHDNLGSSRSVRNADKSLYACRARQAARRRFYVSVTRHPWCAFQRLEAAATVTAQRQGIASLRLQG